jgi:arylsulfatase A
MKSPHVQSPATILISVLATFISFNSAAAHQRSGSPNIVLVLADDLGYGDLGCFGHPEIRTPHLDRLASEGMRFTSCYSASANCSPARAGLMTGRTPYRAGIHNWIPFMSPMHLRAEEVTVAKLLRDSGYDTCHVGKWHLNGLFNLPGQPQPNEHGFNHWFSVQNNALPNHREPYNFVRNGIPVGPQPGYSSQIVAAEAIRWLRDVRDKSKPFFLFVCFNEPHEPIATEKKFSDMYEYPDDPSRAAYYGNVSQMDDSFGRLMEELNRPELRDTTYVQFTSDNGPARTKYHNVGSSGPLREFKGHIYDGGIRVPGIVRWPGHVRPGTVSDEPVCGVDFLPTACAVAGVNAPAGRPLDGVSLLPAFAGGSVQRTAPLYWQFNWAGSAPKVACRVGDWKILGRLSAVPAGRTDITAADEQLLKTATLEGFELYNLRDDIGERTDLSEREPRKLAELSGVLRKMYAEVQRETPTWPDWKFPGYEGKRIQWPDYVAKPLPAEK